MLPDSTLTLEVEDDAALAASGDADALGRLYERYADKVLRFLLLKTANNVTVAEDLASNTWESVARAIRSYTSQGSGFPAWLFTIAKRQAAEHYRHTGRRKEYLDGEMLYDAGASVEGVDETYQRQVLGHQVADAVRRLNTAQRNCVHLRFYAGLTLKETAEVMGKKPNAIKQLQHRALASLHSQLGDLAPRVIAAETVVLAADALMTVTPEGETA